MALQPYLGNPAGPGSAGFVGTVMLPDDGDDWTAAEFNPAYELQMDDLCFLAATTASAVTFTITNPNGISTYTVASVADGPPAVLTTSGAHDLQTGMTIEISGATGDTAINGIYPVTVIDTFNFSIPVTGSGSYVADTATVLVVTTAWMRRRTGRGVRRGRGRGRGSLRLCGHWRGLGERRRRRRSSACRRLSHAASGQLRGRGRHRRERRGRQRRRAPVYAGDGRRRRRIHHCRSGERA